MPARARVIIDNDHAGSPEGRRDGVRHDLPETRILARHETRFEVANNCPNFVAFAANRAVS